MFFAPSPQCGRAGPLQEEIERQPRPLSTALCSFAASEKACAVSLPMTFSAADEFGPLLLLGSPWGQWASRCRFRPWRWRAPLKDGSHRKRLWPFIQLIWRKIPRFFLATTRRTHRTQNHRCRKEAKTGVLDFIEPLNNPMRRHSTLRYLSPIEIEARIAAP